LEKAFVLFLKKNEKKNKTFYITWVEGYLQADARKAPEQECDIVISEKLFYFIDQSSILQPGIHCTTQLCILLFLHHF